MKNNDFWEKRKILPTITTITKSIWREKIEEVKTLRLKEIFLFLTCLNNKERKELYKLLKKTKVERIPLVHIKTEMEPWELDYLVKNYNTEAFNAHTEREYPFLYNYEKYRNIIYIENTTLPLDEKEIENFAGICLDLSHLENDRLLRKDVYEDNVKLIEKYRPGCNHISAIKKSPFLEEKIGLRYDSHYFEDLSEFDYLKKYPPNYYSFLIAIEVENSIEEQLRARDYIIDLLKNK